MSSPTIGRRLFCFSFLACSFAHTLSALYAQGTIFNQMDAASARFKNAQADVKYDIYTRAAKAHDLSSGSIYIERSGATGSMGAVISSEGASSPDKVLAYGGGLLQIYTPGTNQVDIFKAGANQAKYESFLTLGFGGSGRDLQKQWTVSDQGTEILDGVTTERLDLVSKDPSVASLFAHVTLWVDPARDVSIKQMFFAPNGDTRTTIYSNIRMNGKIEKGRYAISKGATRIMH